EDSFEETFDPFFDPFFMENQEFETVSEVDNEGLEGGVPEEIESIQAFIDGGASIQKEEQEKSLYEPDSGSLDITEEANIENQQGRLFKGVIDTDVQQIESEQTSIPHPQGPAVILPPVDSTFLLHDSSKDEYRMLTIILRSNFHEEERGLKRMKRVLGVLRSYPGSDKFGLMIFENGQRVSMEFPNDTTGYCPELMRRLKEMVGEDNIQIKINKVH
ncbi:MAG TPA: hypothetical protein VK856_06940, partial [Anaerolineaceae bacterium]|nr:hypothetical protein [Anaerolineaceae bacterium]